MSSLCTTWRMSMSNAAVVLGCYSRVTVCTRACACVRARVRVCVSPASCRSRLFVGWSERWLIVVSVDSGVERGEWQQNLYLALLLLIKWLNGISRIRRLLSVFRAKLWKSTPPLSTPLQSGVGSALRDHLSFFCFFAPGPNVVCPRSIAFGKKLQIKG